MKENKWAEIVAKAWSDEAFKKELLANPEKVLTQFGLPKPKSKIKVVENTADTTYLVLPQKPAKSGLSQEELTKLAGTGGNQVVFQVGFGE